MFVFACFCQSRFFAVVGGESLQMFLTKLVFKIGAYMYELYIQKCVGTMACAMCDLLCSCWSVLDY